MLAGGSMWFWLQIENYFSSILVTILSYPIYILIGTLPAYLVSTRSSTQHLINGLKSSAVSWIVWIIIFFSFGVQLSIPYMIIVLLCFALGGVLGSFMALRTKLQNMLR
jgi:uncharacterized membrane protein YqgA involved in biofilm formation